MDYLYNIIYILVILWEYREVKFDELEVRFDVVQCNGQFYRLEFEW
jgi:hypothetical protein